MHCLMSKSLHIWVESHNGPIRPVYRDIIHLQLRVCRDLKKFPEGPQILLPVDARTLLFSLKSTF